MRMCGRPWMKSGHRGEEEAQVTNVGKPCTSTSVLSARHDYTSGTLYHSSTFTSAMSLSTLHLGCLSFHLAWDLTV